MKVLYTFMCIVYKFPELCRIYLLLILRLGTHQLSNLDLLKLYKLNQRHELSILDSSCL